MTPPRIWVEKNLFRLGFSICSWAVFIVATRLWFLKFTSLKHNFVTQVSFPLSLCFKLCYFAFIVSSLKFVFPFKKWTWTIISSANVAKHLTLTVHNMVYCSLEKLPFYDGLNPLFLNLLLSYFPLFSCSVLLVFCLFLWQRCFIIWQKSLHLLYNSISKALQDG